MSISAPPPEQGLDIHRRLCANDPIAPHDLCVAYLPHLLDYLKRVAPHVDRDAHLQAADEALANLSMAPHSYDPGRGDLALYLRMSARGDLLKHLKRESRHHDGRISWKSVEDRPDAWKYLGREDEPPAEPLKLFADLDETEQSVLALMCEGERKTEVYAEAMHASHLSLGEQRRDVKRMKDRIKKRLQRAGGPYDRSA
jgi:RNA polymerase sigma-70 factor (ECF subfamily)